MKQLIVYLLLLVAVPATAQTDLLKRYQTADSFFKARNFPEAYNIYKEIEPKMEKEDTLYSYVIWYATMSATLAESSYRANEQWENSLKYGLEALQWIGKGKDLFDEKFAAREAWMRKNVIVSYFGLGQLANAQKHKDILYTAYKNKELPDGIDGYFNYSFFKWKDKNIWGYEWFEELPEDRFSKSFTKIVYYVYSTNPDGSDKEQLSRYHVLMFHQDPKDAEFDYLLERQQETETQRISGSYYSYVYKKEIDYDKLKKDILEILEKDIQPDTRRTTQLK